MSDVTHNRTDLNAVVVFVGDHNPAPLVLVHGHRGRSVELAPLVARLAELELEQALAVEHLQCTHSAFYTLNRKQNKTKQSTLQTVVILFLLFSAHV